MKIRPLGDRVVVRRIEPPKQSQGGIYYPETAQQRPRKAQVLFVGPGKRMDDGTRLEMSLKKGDIILFAAYAGNDVESKNAKEELLVLREDEVLGVVEEE